jgi:hypothetical protein
MNGQNGWLELMLTTNAGNYNYPITYYIDSWRFTTPSAAAPGDYNGDGNVDAADYVVWRKSPGDFGGDPAGYDTWRNHYGSTGAGGGAGGLAGTVPEPTTLLLAGLAGCLIGLRRRA